MNPEIAASAVRKSDTSQHEDNASLSQLYTTGHLAEEVASSVIRSVSKEVEQIHKDSQEDENEEWIHISQDPSSMHPNYQVRTASSVLYVRSLRANGHIPLNQSIGDRMMSISEVHTVSNS